MPTKHFFSLSFEKQEKIINASIKEFTNVEYQDASINKIIKDTNISRGSFYYYFTGKDDLYKYILENFINSIEEKMLIDKDKDDIFTIMRKVFDFFLSKRDSSDSNFIRNVIKNMKPGTQHFFVELLYNKLIVGLSNQEKTKYKLKYNSDKDIKNLFGMIFCSFIFCVSKLYLWNGIKEEVESIYNISMDIITNGALKGEINV